MNEFGDSPAATGDPVTGTKEPLAAEHVGVTWMQAVNTLISFEPAFATNRVFASAALHCVVAEVTPAHREKARPEGFVPAM